MNILLLTRWFSNITGGEYIMKIIADLLVKNDQKVWVITNRIEGTEYTKHPNLKIIFVANYDNDAIKHWKQSYKIKYFFSALKKGLEIIKRDKIEIIYSNPYEPILSGSVLSLLTSKPHIMLIHDLYVLNKEMLYGLKKFEKKPNWTIIMGQFFNKLVFKSHCSAIHTVSDSTKEDLKKIGISKPIFVIPNSIQINNDVIENVTPEPFLFVCISRLVHFKNVEIVIKALKIVKKSFPYVKLVIIGDGPHRTILEELVTRLDLGNNVEFKGRLSEHEKIIFLKSSQALVFPSLFEGFGLVILEAFRECRPVLVSNIKPVSDIIEDKKTGLIVSENDENKWAEAIEFILKNKEHSSKMGENGRKVLEKKYSPNVMIEKIIQMYSNVV